MNPSEGVWLIFLSCSKLSSNHNLPQRYSHSMWIFLGPVSKVYGKIIFPTNARTVAKLIELVATASGDLWACPPSINTLEPLASHGLLSNEQA